MPTKSQRVDFIMIAQSRLEQCKSFMVPVINNILIGYTEKLSPQVGSFQDVFKKLGKLGKFNLPGKKKPEILIIGAEDCVPKKFKPVDGIERDKAIRFLAFFLYVKTAFDRLKLITSLLEKNQTASALRELGPLNGMLRSLIGAANEPYIQLFLPYSSLKVVQEGLGRVFTMADQATRILIAAGEQAAA